MNSMDNARDLATAAADRLYYTRGIQAVSMDELRSETGLSLKKLYALFPSKEAIVLAVLQSRHQQWAAGLDRAAAAAGTPRERLLSIYDYLLECFVDDDYRGCGFVNAFGELGATVPAVAEAARAQKVGFQDYVARLVAEAGAPASLAPMLVLLAEGAQTTAAICGTPDAARSARAAAETLLDVAVVA